MPLTPFHWSVIIFGFIAFEVFYLPALAISSVAMDLEPFYYMFISPNAEGTLHGFWHTYLGVTLLALVVAFVLIMFRKRFDAVAQIFKVEQPKISNGKVVFSSLFAAWSHVFLDSFMHWDLQPFWPISTANPFLGLISIFLINTGTSVILLLVFVMWLVRLAKKN